MKPPFAWFGGKRLIAHEVWRRFGDVKSYVEPFFGSGAVLLARPDDHSKRRELVCDINCFVANFFRSMKYDSDTVCRESENPLNHVDLVAWRWWCARRKSEVYEAMSNDPEWYDAKLAGKWVWCVKNSIGTDMMCEKKVNSMQALGRVVNSQIEPLPESFALALKDRLANVAVLCGDWKQCTSNAALNIECRDVGVFLDPPYNDGKSYKKMYGLRDHSVAEDVLNWCLDESHRDIKIALCGYHGTSNDMLLDLGWSALRWVANGGYANRSKKKENINRKLETIYFSPACNKVED